MSVAVSSERHRSAVCFGMHLYTETGLKVPGEVLGYKSRSLVKYCGHNNSLACHGHSPLVDGW